jgi:hypothetical protein
VERDKYGLDGYIKRFKENEKDVLRAKRNINNYKKELHNKSLEREAAHKEKVQAKQNKEKRNEGENKIPTKQVQGPSKQAIINGTP